MKDDPGFRSPLAVDANAGRVAIVTGGGTGIGRATARELVRSGARVAICGRRPEPLEHVRRELGDGCMVVACDVREDEQVAAMLDRIEDGLGPVDILVNNAGGQFSAPLEQISLKGLRAVHRLNIDANWNLTQRVANRWMIPRRRGFVAFVGFSPRRGVPTMVHSSMARSALETFAAGISLEWSRYGIRAVCVSCGLIDTEGVRGYGGQALLEQWAAAVPLKRAGLADEVGATIAFLASPGGGYITGTTVVIDGGADAWGLGTSPPDVEPRGSDAASTTAPPSEYPSHDDPRGGHMYGTVARTRVKPENREALRKVFEAQSEADVPGYVKAYALWENGSDVMWLFAIFDDRDSYETNANDPAQHERYVEYRALMEEEPEWHDGEIDGDGRS